jgi:hypothetical protein
MSSQSFKKTNDETRVVHYGPKILFFDQNFFIKQGVLCGL